MSVDRPYTASGQENDVRKYYDDNTKMFLKHGEHGKTHGIHQPLYFEEHETIQSAMHGQHAMILDRIDVKNVPYHVVDLGCGVGGSMRYLSSHSSANADYTGISISPWQIEQAQQIHAQSERMRFVCASFQDIPVELSNLDFAYSIEGFIHSPDAGIFFQQVSRCLKPGGQLLLFDDFLNREAESQSDNRVLKEFHDGWKANSLLSVEAISALASTSGLSLVEDLDLSQYLRLDRPRDYAIAAIAPILRIIRLRHQYAIFLLGGNARQQGFSKRLLSYRMLAFTKALKS
jgi:cyclopropane fatty-acyl-phospholipid synthase-like methyltransferase